MKDARGIERGACKKCDCSQYCPPGDDSGNLKCTRATCLHPPGLHQNLSAAPAPGIQKGPATCSVLGCHQAVDFDPNTGVEMKHCCGHAGQSHAASLYTTGKRVENGDVVMIAQLPQQDG